MRSRRATLGGANTRMSILLALTARPESLSRVVDRGRRTDPYRNRPLREQRGPAAKMTGQPHCRQTAPVLGGQLRNGVGKNLVRLGLIDRARRALGLVFSEKCRPIKWLGAQKLLSALPRRFDVGEMCLELLSDLGQRTLHDYGALLAERLAQTFVEGSRS